MNAADIIADRLIHRGIYLERYKAGLNNRILALLQTLETDLTKELAAADPTGVLANASRRKRLENLLASTRQTIGRVYREGDKTTQADLAKLAENEQLYTVGAINETAGISIAEISTNFEQLKTLTNGSLIQGAQSGNWWKRQSEDLARRFSDQMQAGVLRGETLAELVSRVRGTRDASFKNGIMQVSRRNAEALVRTSVQNVANGARRDVYQANQDVVSAIQWVSTLDSRTTPICVGLSGKMWTTRDKTPIGHAHPFPGDTAHWNCRSIQVPVIKAWEDLVAKLDQGKVDEEFRKNLAAQGFTPDQIAKIKRDTRSSLDGQVAKDITFDAWLKTKDEAFQDKLLGSGKAKLFRAGKINTTDLIDQTNRPLTLAELMDLPQPRPVAPEVKIPGRRPRKAKPETPKRGEGDFPPLTETEEVRKLGGSTGATLVKDTQNGRQFVRKMGNSADHIREEMAADAAYQAAGFKVPKAVLFETASGPVKLAEYIEGVTLDKFLASAPADAQKAVLEQIRKGFVMDSLMANYDVAGLSLDNILVDAKGVAWRIDNGGSLRFRAQGLAKSSAQWNGAVQELETMRNSSINPSTAKIFQGITEADIEDQIRDVLTKQDAILAALPEDVRPVMLKRFETLKGRLDTLVSETYAKKVQESGVSGVRLVGDRDELEDVQLLIWTEKDLNGAEITQAKIKLTSRGAEKVMNQIRDSIKEMPKPAPVAAPLPEDTFWNKILAAAKTVGKHANDGKYNAATLKDLVEADLELQLLYTPTKALQDMKAAYLQMIQDINAAKAAGVPTPNFKQFLPKLEKVPAAPKMAGRFNVTESNLTWNAKKITGKSAQQIPGIVKVNGSDLRHFGYEIKLGGANARFIPYVKPDGQVPGTLKGLFGQLEIAVEGPATRQNIQRTIDALKELGLNPTKADPDYLEAVWIRKTLEMRRDVIDVNTRKRITELMTLDGIPDAERVKELRQIARAKLGIEPPKDPSNWVPKMDTSEKGWGSTNRWDIPPDAMEKEMKDYLLHHHSYSTPMPDFVESLLDQGTSFGSTTERVRKGFPAINGLSPEDDLRNGPATHIFTRIKTIPQAKKTTGLVFKVRNLARQDAFSFYGDYMDHQYSFQESVLNNRGKIPKDFQRFVNNSSNETLLKNEISLLDELESIVVANDQEAKQIMASFKKRGITKLTDGRTIDSIIRKTSDPIK